MNKSIDIELISKPRTYELQRLLSIKMTEFLENSCSYAIRRVLPGKFSCYLIMKKYIINYLAELDTIYRQINQADEEQDDDRIVQKESTKINEYLTYNW